MAELILQHLLRPQSDGCDNLVLRGGGRGAAERRNRHDDLFAFRSGPSDV